MLVMRVDVVMMVVPAPASHPSLLLYVLGEKHRFPSSIVQYVQRRHLWSGQAETLQLWVSWALEVSKVSQRGQQMVRLVVMLRVTARVSIEWPTRDTIGT